MSGLVALMGGDEFRAGCREMDLAILNATGKESPSVLVLPTAAAQENPSRAASNGVAYFSALGADAVGVDGSSSRTTPTTRSWCDR